MIPKCAIVPIAFSLVSLAPAPQPFKPGKLPPAEVAALKPGLTLRLFAKAAGTKSLDARQVRLAALHVPAGTPPSPFVAAGPFHARLSGYLKNRLKGMYSFRLVGSGVATLRINDKTVLTLPRDKDKSVEIELAKNYNRIEIDCASSAKGESTVRLYWSGEGFGFEPVPPEVLFSRGDDADLVQQTAVREGRELYATHACARCHGLIENLKLPDCQMPEMHARAAQLDDAGHRFQSDWLAAWMLNPRSLRPDATMPRILVGPDAARHARDIAAYLASVKSGPAPRPLGDAPKASDGEALFRKLACNSCHRFSEPSQKDELGRLSLDHVGAKYQPHALAHFLKEPQKHRPWIRMPDFKLSDAEAGQLEAYLRKESKGKVAVHEKGDARRGEKLFRGMGCQNCHLVGAPPKFLVRFGRHDRLDQGCLAAKDHGRAPDFGMTDAQRAGLAAFLKTDGKSLTRETPAEFSRRQVKSLQCNSCHRRDGGTTRWYQVLEEDGKEPEKLPSLTWAGEKLKPAWTKKLLAGIPDHRARPWIKARMPAFPVRAELLAVGLSHEHGFAIDEDERPKPDPKLAAIGEKLIPQQGGFNCNNCHGIGKQPAIQPFEAPGINLTDAAIRLRYEYYRRWMLRPDRVDVVMRMPIFATDGKTTQIRDVLGGDARLQFDALWHYIQTLPSGGR
ncbi:MAG: c-type cytochrome [Planctomycetes bacterium]|nr:c-type cytochrome [Planctomycetota bacterium]